MPTLLLADPSAAIRRVVEMTFADTGVDVVSASDGEEAIASIAEKRPDIVLADIGMPKRSGYDVCEWVKAQDEHKQVPVLLLAGAFEPVDDDRARAAGCNGVLVKPFEPQHVIARVQELLGGVIGGPRRATADVPRPAARLTAPRPVELPSRSARDEVPDDLVDMGAGDFGDEAVARDEPAPAARSGPAPDAGRGSDALDDYFDQLDEAVTSVGDWSGSVMPAQGDPPLGPRPASPATGFDGGPEAFAADDAADDGEDDAEGDGALPTLEDLLATETGGEGDVSADRDEDEMHAGTIPTLEELLDTRDEPAPSAAVAGPRNRPADEPLPAAVASPGAPPTPVPEVTDELVEDITQRVTARLAAAHGAAIEQAVARAVQAAVEPAVRAAVDAAAGPAVGRAVERAAAELTDRLAREAASAVEAKLPPVLERAAAEVSRAADIEVARAADAEVARVVADVVAEVSERLVREEIARIRKQA